MEEIEVGQDVVQPTRRRRHSKEFKAQVVRAAVALHYRLNANMVRSWVATQEELDAAEEARKLMGAPPVEFVPLQLQLETPGVAPGPMEIQIEVRRGAATVTVRWPVSAASDCALWLQGWLR